MGINDIKIRPLNSISDSNKIFSSASICEYFSEITNINDVIKIREKLEKGEIVLFQSKQKENLKETDSEMSIQSNELVNNDEEVIN
ncbi:hypothetical protein [Spiroplasma endosymbiont of Melieria omissa]|uniref:hypothetical protein n=1 Tax=Spiroplasma endosymbiont of Melieria omissa TaxID=3139324 RepID=UPI003CCAC7A5